MERVKISYLKLNIKIAKQKKLSQREKETIDQIENSVRNCPAQYLRISKMNKFIENILGRNNEVGI
jgi:hypothetical protein